MSATFLALNTRNKILPTLLTHAAQLLTLRNSSGGTGPRRAAEMRELGVIEDGAVLIAEGKIVAVGTTDELAKHELLTAKVATLTRSIAPARSCSPASLTRTRILSLPRRG